MPAKRMQSAGVHRALLQIIKKEAPTVKKAPAVQVVKQAAVQKVVEVLTTASCTPRGSQHRMQGAAMTS